MNAKGINYEPSEKHDVLTLMSARGFVFATKRIRKELPTPKYPGAHVFRDSLAPETETEDED